MSIKRIFALLLTVVMLVCVFAACNKPEHPEETTPVASDETTTPSEPETPTTPPKKITKFYVTCGDSTVENFAASELKWYLKQKNVSLAEGGYHISIVIDETVVKDGYKIVADENSLILAGGNERGLVCGIYDFLEKYVGVRFYATNTVIVNDEDIMIGGGVLENFVPAFEVLRNPWHPIDKLAEKDGGSIKTEDSTKIMALNTIAGTGSVTTCLSDSEVFERALQNVKNQLSTGHATAVRFSPVTDYDLYCTCESCAAVHEEEGSPAGNYIRFLNKLFEAISVEYPDVKFEIVPRAYLKEAPSVTKPVPGVWIRFDMDKCHISHPVTSTECPVATSFAASIKSWSEFCDNVSVEYRLTATKEYMPVFANLGALHGNMSFFAECGVAKINFTGNIACPAGDFGELRIYLISKLLQNPTMSEEEYYALMDEFLEAFYGEGWTYIRKFIDKIIELSADGQQTPKDDPFASITKEEYLANAADFDKWWNKAEELSGDRADFVKRSRFQWRYIKLCLQPNKAEALAMIEENARSFNERIAWREAQWNVDTNKTNFDLTPPEWIYRS